jgi:uncharacterized protein
VTFVDTSALLAFLDRDATRHEEVVASSIELFRERCALTHNYVVIETEALARRRLGTNVALRLLEDVVPVLEIVWVDAVLHEAAVTAHLRSLRRRSTLVDHVSFELMRRRGISSVLALDLDFAREGFDLILRL